MQPGPVLSAEDAQREIQHCLALRAAAQKKLVLEERRLDVLATILGYRVHPFHALLIRAKRELPGPWRMFLAPRGAGKSTILTVVDCVLLALTDPDVRILIASRVKDQAKDLLTEVQGCFERERFVELFGDLRGDKWGTGEATIRTRTRKWKEPTWLAAGADGPVTSKHFDHIKVDDLVDEKNSRTDGEREKIHVFFYKTLVPCLVHVRDDGRPGEIDVVGTRYHPDDEYGRLMSVDPKFKGNVCEVPALVDPVTGERNPLGVSVVPEILPTDDLKALRVSMGPAHFDSQFQQTTARLRGDIFNCDVFQYFDDDPADLVEKKQLKVWAACDLAIGEHEKSDEYADAVVGVDDRNPSSLDVYLLEIFHGRVPYTVQIARAREIFERWDPIRFGIEANAFQKSRLFSVYRELGEEIGDRCVPVTTLTDKVTRAWKLSARYEAGRIWHRRNDRGTDDYEEQLVGFPRGKHDDMFDAVDLAVALGCVVRARKKRERHVGVFGIGPRLGRTALAVSR
jgi:predicted phage terminase large subunit-like protein